MHQKVKLLSFIGYNRKVPCAHRSHLALQVDRKMKKGATIKSYLIKMALILAGFKMWKQSKTNPTFDYQIQYFKSLLYCTFVNLYLVVWQIYLIRFLCQSTAQRCVQTASTRCVFKIYNVTRLALLCIPLETRSWKNPPLCARRCICMILFLALCCTWTFSFSWIFSWISSPWAYVGSYFTSKSPWAYIGHSFR